MCVSQLKYSCMIPLSNDNQITYKKICKNIEKRELHHSSFIF